MPLPETFDAFVPSKFVDLLARAKFNPVYVELAELRELDETISTFKSSLELAEKFYSPTLLDHCLRCYYFALAILHSGFPSQTPFVPQIPRDVLVKELYLTCLLHDIGLSSNKDVTTHPAHTMTFEFHGGIMAYEHLRADYAPSQQLKDSQIANITQSIMLHTSVFGQGMSSAAGSLMQLTAFLDVFGFGVFGPDSMTSRINRDTVREIEQAYPRTDIAELDQEFQTLIESRPTCLLNHFPFYTGKPELGPDPVSDSH
ncbi:hypothetical protein GYMLUDRAFT_40200 [Collybiopsis luxurians FD-317 M1]|uniref:HD domain-containing protein n=1 Tax=Collybiopsis luxurians FD-317 M1 TaxID=944289 RepID=A0A0D0BIQ6_9AGAR|nr:hypothetical protein GYMLUDRAFT_40200 [Collybiopsis luxurians FD-317 M1]